MLSRLYVKNVALISEADITFDTGLNILSGETGSGKSVILDSVNFVLGSKADRNMIRYGENEAFVRAEFIVPPQSKALLILNEYDIETDGTIIITRRLSTDGKSVIKINGNSVSVTMLKNLTQHLVDVHGQSEHFFLLNEDNQLRVIDVLLGKEGDDIKESLAATIAQKKQLNSKIAALGGDEAERARKLDLLNFQINEIENADIKVGEFDELKSRQNIAINIEKILSALNGVRGIFSDDGGVSDGIFTAMREMSRISGIDNEYSQIYSRLEALSNEASDISECVSDLSDSLTFDENEVNYIEDRLGLIKALQKKYGPDEQSIIDFKDKAKAEFEAISDSSALIEKYSEQITDCDNIIFDLCKRLSELRQHTAKLFSARVVDELKTLNIPYANFCVNFKTFDRGTANLFSANGSDSVCFEFSANKGEPLKALNKVISGGEMSRFMLAVKTQLKDLNGISTYIFDEIDAGISGFTAGKVAKKFLDISKHTQVIAVSHLPQVCAASTCQFLIYKCEEDGKTLTYVKKLNENERIDEIVRLTGSVKSDAAITHAKELINQYK